MRFAVGCIDHDPFEIRLVYGDLEQLLPDAVVPPTTKAFVDAVPIAVFRRHSPPGHTGTENSYDCIDRETIVLCDTAPVALFTRQVRGYK